MLFVLIGFWALQRHVEEVHARKAKNDRLPRLEWACDFSATKFATSFRLVREEQISGAHCLAFHYLSAVAARRAVRSGLPATAFSPASSSSSSSSSSSLRLAKEKEQKQDASEGWDTQVVSEVGGVLLTLHGPHELTVSYRRAFPDGTREAVLVISLPRRLIEAAPPQHRQKKKE